VTTLGWVGVGLLVAAVVGIVIEVVVAALWSRAVAKRALTFQERLAAERGLVESDLENLRLALEETQRLWKPYGRALRWLRHPLTIAVLQSFARRRLAR
jgi:hypothetical protein